MSVIIGCLPSRRQLRQHLGRLVDHLEGLVERLRENIARNVGELVADVVREVAFLLTGAPSRSTARSDWSEQEPWRDSPDFGWDGGPAYARDPDPDDAPRTAPEAPVSRGRRALSLGCQAAAWWLVRQVGHRPVLCATGIGLTAALLSYAAGPVVGVGLAAVGGAFLHLLALTDSLARGVGVIDG